MDVLKTLTYSEVIQVDTECKNSLLADFQMTL